MPSEKAPFYDPVPPTYDEALAGGSNYDPEWVRSRSPTDERNATETESQGLLQHSSTNGASSSSRRPDGYRPPTVETDDEDSLWDSESDSDDEEAAQVRREMQEMEIEEPDRSRGSIWGKRIPFSISLPRWKWSWRPRLPRWRIQLPSRAPAATTSSDADNDDNNNTETETQPRRWFKWPKFNRTMAIIMFARILAVVIILSFLYLIFASDFFGGISDRLNGGFRFNPEDLRAHIQSNVDPRRMRASVQHFSSYAHIAGTEGDYATAMDVESMFSRAGLDEVSVDEYYVYLNYPKKDGRTVQIMDKDGKKATWTASLEEEDVGGKTAGHQTYAFHGHSKSGDVQGPLIYANYGSREDFKKLRDKGIKTKGAIALVRYHGTQPDRALKVKAAEIAGFAGCLIYSDPADDGFLAGDVAPHGSYMPADGVQRGSVSLMSWMIGDVLTPGWESKKGLPRMKLEDSPGLVGIPSLPLAWRDAQVLLQHLEGHGEKVFSDWKGGVPDVMEWWTGDDSSPIVRLQNEQDAEEQQPIWNVYGKIIGMEQGAKSIIIGNHRDSWALGATDPHSGTAVLIETARIFGDLVQRGWRPLRTIEFMSWDAKEYNLIGSTEFVENNLDSLRNNAYAYINLDTVVAGPEFRAAGSPVFQKSLLFALGRVLDPQTNETLKDTWLNLHGGELEGLAASSDYAAFQDIAGTSSLDLGFGGRTIPHHSSYDNFKLMEDVIDPGFVYHTLMGQIVGLLLLDLADRAIVPFDMAAYGRSLEKWVNDLDKWVSKEAAESKQGQSFSLQELKDAVKEIQKNAEIFENWEHEWDRMVMQSGGWESTEVGEFRLDYNNKVANFETALLDLELGGGVSLNSYFH